MTPRSQGQVPALDGVRGLAIALILVYHFTMGLTPTGPLAKLLIKLGSMGWCGVDLFFVLSGFLITRTLDDAREISKPRIFRNFYGRRILRVFPLYFGVLLTFSLLGPTPGFAGLESSTLWNWTFNVNNLVAIRGDWYPLSHLWSLAVEEHFYLVWPFVVVLGGRTTALRSTAVLMAVGLVARTCMVYSGASLGAYVLTLCRVDSLALGGALALLLQTDETAKHLSKTRLQTLNLASWGCLSAMILCRRGLSFHDPVIQIAGYPLLALCSASLIATALSSPAIASRLADRSLVRLGRYSFGLYVFNSIAILVLDGQNAKPRLRQATGSILLVDLGYVALGLLLTFSAAWLSWNLLEKHALKLKVFFNDRASQPSSDIRTTPRCSLLPALRYAETAFETNVSKAEVARSS